MGDSLDLESVASAVDNVTLTQPAKARFFFGSIKRAVWKQIRLDRVALFVASLFLFILAVMLMKDGARIIAPLIGSGFVVNSTANSLGFGWLFAYLIMSGSPVAAAALTFFDAGAIDKLEAFTMITGSRLGASFIVLFIGFVYVLRGRDRATSLGMGLLSLMVTGTTHLVGLAIGTPMLQMGLLDTIQLRSGMLLNSIIDVAFDPIIDFLAAFLPVWMLFPVGLGVIMLSFKLFDRCLPQVKVKESEVGKTSRLIYRPWVMFILGASITMISMSVSVSLGILVPLSERGFVRRENVVPYIMGANVTTFVDTLLAAVLLNNPLAFTIVLVEMVSIAVVSMIVLLVSYYRYERAMLDFVNWITANNRNLALFMITIFVVPIILMLVN